MSRSPDLWEKVRRVLGRLASSTHVRDISPAASGAAVNLGSADVLLRDDIAAGHQESSWRPTARIATVQALDAPSGAEGADLAKVAVVIGMNGAIGATSEAVHVCPPIALDVRTHAQDLLDPAIMGLGVLPVQVDLGGSRSHGAHVRMVQAGVSQLQTMPPRLPERPRRSQDQSALLQIGTRVKSRVSVGLEVPILRERRPAPQGQRFAEAFQAERRELARASQLDLADVALLGVYPRVPLAAVARLGLEEEGRELSLWIKPEAIVSAAQGKAPRLATLIVGRQRSTGRMLQAIG